MGRALGVLAGVAALVLLTLLLSRGRLNPPPQRPIAPSVYPSDRVGAAGALRKQFIAAAGDGRYEEALHLGQRLISEVSMSERDEAYCLVRTMLHKYLQDKRAAADDLVRHYNDSTHAPKKQSLSEEEQRIRLERIARSDHVSEAEAVFLSLGDERLCDSLLPLVGSLIAQLADPKRRALLIGLLNNFALDQSKQILVDQARLGLTADERLSAVNCLQRRVLTGADLAILCTCYKAEPSEVVRAAIVILAGRSAADGGRSLVMEAVYDPSDIVREQAILKLNTRDDDERRMLLSLGSSDTSRAIREAVFWQLESATPNPALAEFLMHWAEAGESEGTRSAAVRWFGRQYDLTKEPALSARLQRIAESDKSELVRECAMDALRSKR
jgi:hypothetical protein